MSEINITVTVNGTKVNANVKPEMNLLRFLREHGFYDVKCGCEMGDCGTCTVFFNGQTVKSCITLAAQADGGTVWTNKGLGVVDDLTQKLQKAIVEHGSIQCGFCTPGFVMSITALLRDNPNPTDEQIREGLSGNFCRCTGYQGIINAVRQAAEAGTP